MAHLAPAYINAGQYDQALRVVEMISDAKYKAEGLARIALKCAEAGQRERSFETFSQAVRTAKTIKKRGPKRAVLIQIIRWYMETGKYSHTLETVKAIQDASLEAEMLINWITPKYEEAGLVSKAAQLYAQAERAIERMKNSPEKGMWMARISKIYAKAGQYERALQVARGIKNGQAKVEALLDIAEQYAAAQ